MATRRENLETALDRVCQELADGPMKPSYSIDGQNVNWVQYRQHLTDEVERLTALIDLMDDGGGIVEEVTQITT